MYDHFDELKDWIESFGAPRPDLAFDACRLDPVGRDDYEGGLPLKGVNVTQQYYQLPGCYAFVNDVDELFPSVRRVAYVGKGMNIRGRLISQWLHGKWPDRWMDDHFDEFGDYIPMPTALCWFTSPIERAGLEAQLIDALKPTYNKNRP